MNEVMRRAFRAYCGGHDMLSQDEKATIRDWLTAAFMFERKPVEISREEKPVKFKLVEDK